MKIFFLPDKSFLAYFPNSKIILFHHFTSDVLKGQVLCSDIQIVPILSFPVFGVHTFIFYFLMTCLTLNYRPLLYVECLRFCITVCIYCCLVLTVSDFEDIRQKILLLKEPCGAVCFTDSGLFDLLQ